MMVTFVSRCEKKSLARTRRILDAFAVRIGDNTWQTAITLEGLDACRKLLRKTAAKNTAVACHVIRSRRRSELLWIVGNRRCFNDTGAAPVNTTRRSLLSDDTENGWRYLPAIKALAAVAALLHDWGKASNCFQAKLRRQKNDSDAVQGDPLRHEWISCLLLRAWVAQCGHTDHSWLESGTPVLPASAKLRTTLSTETEDDEFHVLKDLPPAALMVGWLILSHHRLPLPDRDTCQNQKDTPAPDADMLSALIDAGWGYRNRFDPGEYNRLLKTCTEFSGGLLQESSEWNKQLKKWTVRLLHELPVLEEAKQSGGLRVILHHARLCLILGDHHFSSLPGAPRSEPPAKNTLAANTQKSRENPGKSELKQLLDEHLTGVCRSALQAAHYLGRIADEADHACDVRNLKKKSPPAFAWQDNAAACVRRFIKERGKHAPEGWFAVNMAGTGTGKTVANAKIMQALSADGNSLRFILALGLRTLTLQTGDVYRNHIGLQEDELAVVIGSKAVQELHEQKEKTETAPLYEEEGSESAEPLLDDEVEYENLPQAEFLNVLFPANHAAKYKAFLYKPVLVCTIDHLMAATETRRGGRFILPALRLLSSDLVIDEADDFDGEDLTALARLVHLAGMLGRKVMISSATIPPDMAEGLFHAYQKGWQCHSAAENKKNTEIAVLWTDEFHSAVHSLTAGGDETAETFRERHAAFTGQRAAALAAQPVRRKGMISPCGAVPAAKPVGKGSETEQSLREAFFSAVYGNILVLHAKHHTADAATGKRVSFGVVRMANIGPCIALTRHLLAAELPNDIALRVLCYHSRQIMLVRSEQEKHLDSVLKRKEAAGGQPAAFSHPVIRRHLDHTDAQDVIFAVVVTPVEEVGRDHDFDWAVIEPSSYRSIIQMSGRVLRHRQLSADIADPNVVLMQFNLRGLYGDIAAFTRPGYEVNTGSGNFLLKNKDLEKITDTAALARGIDALPRIRRNTELKPRENLADLEHAAIAYQLTHYTARGPGFLHGWTDEAWYLTALPQHFRMFRRSEPAEPVFLIPEDGRGRLVPHRHNTDGTLMKAESVYRIGKASLSDTQRQRLWLDVHYPDLLQTQADKQQKKSGNPYREDGSDNEKALQDMAKRFGEINIPDRLKDKKLWYDEALGLSSDDPESASDR